MPDQDAASLNVIFFFSESNRTINPMMTGDLGAGTEGRIDAIENQKKIKIKDNIRVIEELEFDMPMGITGSNTEYEFVNERSDTVDAEDVYIQKVDSAGTVHHEWLYVQSQVAKGPVKGTDHSSKAQDSGKFFLVPKDIIKTR